MNIIGDGEDCPDCDNSGIRKIDTYNIEQCEFCYRNPNSKFNVSRDEKPDPIVYKDRLYIPSLRTHLEAWGFDKVFTPDGKITTMSAGNYMGGNKRAYWKAMDVTPLIPHLNSDLENEWEETGEIANVWDNPPRYWVRANGKVGASVQSYIPKIDAVYGRFRRVLQEKSEPKQEDPPKAKMGIERLKEFSVEGPLTHETRMDGGTVIIDEHDTVCARMQSRKTTLHQIADAHFITHCTNQFDDLVFLANEVLDEHEECIYGGRGDDCVCIHCLAEEALKNALNVAKPAGFDELVQKQLKERI